MKFLRMLCAIICCIATFSVNGGNVSTSGKSDNTSTPPTPAVVANAALTAKKQLKAERRQKNKPAEQPAPIIISN